MGVKTLISLDEANKLFTAHSFTKLQASTSGIMDTTYITDEHILKKYEREVDVQRDSELLESLKAEGLNVSTCQAKSGEWYLYKKLEGSEPRVIKTCHIVALARFLSAFHNITYKKYSTREVIDKSEIRAHLNYTKSKFFGYYKKLEFLKNQLQKNDGLIHGDIFKDNTVFHGTKIGVFDFIDSACGNFAFDGGAALLGFDAKKHNNYFINIFLNTYNQHAPRKLSKKELLLSIETACGFYALKRVANFKNTKTARELLK